jgi:hypothetical protein
MKTITLLLAAAALTFAQTAAPAPAVPAPSKDAKTTAPAVKKHGKKHAKKAATTPAAATPAPVAK